MTRRRALLAAWVLLCGLLLTLVPGHAIAKPKGVKISSRASATQVEVGQPFTVTLSAKGGGVTLSDADLRPPPEFTIVNTELRRHTFVDTSRRSIESGFDASWDLIGSKPGRYVIPAATALVNGKRTKGQPVTVEVVPPTGKGSRSPAAPHNPFLLPGGPGFVFPFGGDPGGVDMDDDAVTDPSLALPAAPDPVAFLRALVDKKSAVIGEQVTVSYYLYCRFSCTQRDFRRPPAPDFLRVPLLQNQNTPQSTAKVGHEKFMAQLLERIALFPIREGELKVGAGTTLLSGRRIGTSFTTVSSEDLAIQVTEPPKDKRPPGYNVGDVGRFSLSATVQPRQTDEGGTIAVTLKLAGTGNLPPTIRVPARTGVEWLDPDVKEHVEVQGGAVGGYRSFGYVVRIKESGTIDLGTAELPFWDPERKRYDIATAQLGTVEVAPGAPKIDPTAKLPTADEVRERDPWSELPRPRRELSAYTPSAPWGGIAGARFWFLLAAPPLLFGFVTLGSKVSQRVRSRRAADKTSPAALAERALREASAAADREDSKAVASAVERAVHAAIEASFGLKSRGVLLENLPGELERRGAPREPADRARDVLAACEAVRFDPDADAKARDLLQRARAVVADLPRPRA